MLSNDLLQRIDDETDIVELVSEFVSLEKKGKNYMGLCPFHDENTPSFSVSTEKNIAMCMGCKEGGRPINFYRKIKNISLMEAAQELGSRIGIEVKVTNQPKTNVNNHLFEIMEDASKFFEVNLFNSVSGETVLNYLTNRGLNEETIKQFKLGYSSKDKDQLYQFLKSKDYSVSDMINLGLVKQSTDGSYYDLFNNRLMFPITNSYGKVVGFSGRTLDKNDNIKYVNSPETPIFKKGEIIYNINEASLDIRRKKNVLLFEGFFDVISAYQAGVKNGIATMGTALTNNQANLIKKTIDRVIIAYDGDKAGINATISAIPTLLNANLIVEALQIPDKMDPDDYIKKFGSKKFEELIESNVVDPYQFQFEHYLSIADLNNANDISIFQSNVTKMLSNAKPAIVALYKNKLSETLNIDVSDIKINSTYKNEPVEYTNNQNDYRPDESYYNQGSTEPMDYTKNLPFNIKAQKKLDNKYIQAEKRILILMIRSKEWHDELFSGFTVSEYSNLNMYVIRTKLKAHYEFNETFDLSNFLEELNESEREYFELNIQKDEFWINQSKFGEEEINEYVTLIKTTGMERRIQYLVDLMKEKGARGLSIKLEQDEYIKLKRDKHNI